MMMRKTILTSAKLLLTVIFESNNSKIDTIKQRLLRQSEAGSTILWA